MCAIFHNWNLSTSYPTSDMNIFDFYHYRSSALSVSIRLWQQQQKTDENSLSFSRYLHPRLLPVCLSAWPVLFVVRYASIWLRSAKWTRSRRCITYCTVYTHSLMLMLLLLLNATICKIENMNNGHSVVLESHTCIPFCDVHLCNEQVGLCGMQMATVVFLREFHSNASISAGRILNEIFVMKWWRGTVLCYHIPKCSPRMTFNELRKSIREKTYFPWPSPGETNVNMEWTAFYTSSFKQTALKSWWNRIPATIAFGRWGQRDGDKYIIGSYHRSSPCPAHQPTSAGISSCQLHKLSSLKSIMLIDFTFTCDLH